MPQDPKQPEAGFPQVDIGKRYDVYCSERNQQVVVYRNALFRGRIKLMSTRPYDIGAEFIELEQSNGQIVYLGFHTVFKFCEPGGVSTAEIIPPKLSV
jgi:hypothetical protein